MKQIPVFSFVFILLCFLISSQTVRAQEREAGISLVPATIEKAVNPGDTLVQTLTVTNVSEADKEYYVYKKNIIGVESGGVPVFAKDAAEKTPYEITEWIQIPSEPIKVSAGQTLELPITIVVPSTASPGSHFGGIFISAEPPKLREMGAGVGYEVVSVISLRIQGDISDSARIRSFSTDRLLYGKKHVVFNAKIENQGNILIRPRGPVSITSMFSKTPVVMTVNDSQAGVFPGTTRDISFTWDSDELGFGRYEAVLALAYDGEGGQKTIDSTLVFWIFPTKIILSILGALLMVILGGYALTRYYINQAIIRAAGGRRIQPQRYRKQVGVSRFAFVFISLMTVLVIFLLIVLVFFA
jgi:hypothetical protein